MQQGGTLYLFDKSVLTFGGNSNVMYSNNTALQQGGAVYSAQHSKTVFTGSSVNIFSGSSSVTFTRNTAMQQGGAVCLFYNAAAAIQDNSNVTCSNSTAMQHGGGVYVHDNTSVSFV